MAIYLKDGIYIDWKTLEFKHAHIRVEAGINGSIKFVTAVPGVRSGDPSGGASADRVLDCNNRLIMKAFGCAHHHVYSALARGMPPPVNAPRNFHDILNSIWWKLDKKLDTKTIEASALVTAMDCAKKGVTFVIDHHSSPNAVENSLFTIAAAFDKVGISHLLCYELSGRDGKISLQKGLEETENYLKAGSQGLVGLHASFTVDDELLCKAVTLAEKYDSGIHAHAAEDLIDQEHTIKRYGKRVIERFNDAGALEQKKTILAHCLHLNDRERKILNRSRAYVVQNAESNLNNKVGFFDPKGYMEKIMLGTDGMHGDMLRSSRAAFLVGRYVEGISPAEIYRRFRKIHDYTGENNCCGDGENNLVILDYDSPTELNSDNFLSHFVYGISSNHIESVIARGKLIVENRKIMTVDEAEILAFSRETAGELWAKLQNRE
jgi:cytosine/adenosine deaminase-related metal-dependent hydrolase